VLPIGRLVTGEGEPLPEEEWPNDATDVTTSGGGAWNQTAPNDGTGAAAVTGSLRWDPTTEPAVGGNDPVEAPALLEIRGCFTHSELAGLASRGRGRLVGIVVETQQTEPMLLALGLGGRLGSSSLLACGSRWRPLSREGDSSGWLLLELRHDLADVVAPAYDSVG